MTNVKKFVADTALLCMKHRVDFNLLGERHVMADGIKCSGYFDESSLVVATYKPEAEWLAILVHESCHLQQWIDKSKLWKKGDSGIYKIDSWLQKKRISDKAVVQALKDTIELELDCEQRSLKMIKKYKLDLEKSLYIKRANAYLFSYWATYRDRKWYPYPYNKPKIYNKLPDKFLPVEEYLNPDTPYLKLYK